MGVPLYISAGLHAFLERSVMHERMHGYTAVDVSEVGCIVVEAGVKQIPAGVFQGGSSRGKCGCAAAH